MEHVIEKQTPQKPLFRDLSNEARRDYLDRANAALASDDLDKFFEIQTECMISKNMTNAAYDALGEEGVQRFKDRGYVFDE